MRRPDDKPKIVIVGAGFAGSWIHARSYRSAGFEVAAICDVNPVAVATAAAEYGIGRTYTEWREMYACEVPDIVSVAVPNMFHEEPVVAALAGGAHVLCEKPLAATVAAAQRMFGAARKAGRHLMTAQMYRWTPGSVAIKAAVDRGDIGHVYYAEATALRRMGIPGGTFHQVGMSGGGPLLDIGVHMLDLTLWLMGNPTARTVSATANRYFGDRADLLPLHHDPEDFTVEDFATAFVRLDGGATLVLRASWAGHVPELDVMNCRIVGSAGGASTAPAVIHRMRGGLLSDETFINLPAIDPYQAEVAHFIDVVRGRAEPIITEAETMNVQRILNAAYESAAKGGEVQVAAS